MKKEKKVLLDFFIYTIGSLGSKLMGFILLPLYTRFLTQKDYGTLDLINTTGQLMFPFFCCQIQTGLYRFLLTKEEKEEEILSTVIFFISGVSLIISSGILFLYIKTQNSLYLIAFSMYFFNFLETVSGQTLRGLNKIKLFSIMGILKTLVVMGLNIYFVAHKNLGFKGVLYSTIISSIIYLIIIFYKGEILNKLDFKAVKLKILKKLLIFTIPLIPNSLNWWIMNLSDRFIITYFLDLKLVGLYAISNKVAGISVIFNQIFYQSWQTHAIKEYDSDQKNIFYSDIFDWLLTIQFTVAILGTIASKYIFKYLLGRDFYEAWIYAPILLLSAVFQSFSSFYGTGYLSSKKTKQAFYTSIYGSMSNLILNIILIKKIGILAAAISTLLAFIIMWISRIKTTKEFFEISINYRKMSIGLVMFLTLYSFVILTNDTFIIFLVSLVVLILWSIVNLEKIKIIKEYAWKKLGWEQ